jgi:hypothetical protein
VEGIDEARGGQAEAELISFAQHLGGDGVGERARTGEERLRMGREKRREKREERRENRECKSAPWLASASGACH